MFAGTDLGSTLKARGVTHLLVCGLMTHACVAGAVRDAVPLGFEVVVAADACATRCADTTTALHAAALPGAGIAAFAQIAVRSDLMRGQPIAILRGHTLGQRGYYALHARARHVPPKVRAFVQHMQQHYAGMAAERQRGLAS